jgi:ATP-dependent Clp protease protease subunit
MSLLSAPVPPSDIEITMNEIKKLQQELYSVIARHSGQPYEKVYEASDRDHWMKAYEAKAFGMIDEVLGEAVTTKAEPVV